MSHLNLSLPLRVRLANHKAGKDYKNRVEGLNVGYRGEGRNRTKIVYGDQSDVERDWRWVGYADELARINHTGWFTDEYQSDTFRGCVAQLPSRDGKELYLVGVCFSANDQCSFDLDATYDDKELAAYLSDLLAYAIRDEQQKEEREYQAKETAKFRVEELREENAKILADARELRKELRAVRACGHTVAAETIRGKINDMLSDYRDNVATIEKIEENYWEAVSH